MSKQPKFLICDNPLTNSGDYVLHTRAPRFLAQVFKHETSGDQKDFGKMLFEKAESGDGDLTMSITNLYEEYYTLVITDLFDHLNRTQESTDELAKIIRRAADWYRAVIKKEIDVYD